MKSIESEKKDSGYILAVSNECPIPLPEKNHILIKTSYSGVNRADIYQAEGNYSPPENVTDVLGLEISGEIIELGEDVKTASKGSKVCALLQGGGYSEYVSVPEWRVLSVPEGVSLEQAAAIPETFLTAYLNIMEVAKLKPNESILIHGGASGVGVAAIQIAKIFGAKVIVTAGSEEKCELCKSLGADIAINYKSQNFVSVVKAAGGVDVVLDMVGGDYIEKNMRVMKAKGRLISIAFINGAKANVNFAPLLMKNLTMVGTTLRHKNEQEIYELIQSARSILWPMFESGDLRVVIDSVFDVEDAGKAHDKMRDFSHIGKILLKF